MSIKLTVNDSELNELCHSPNGVVGRWLLEKGIEVQNAARQFVGTDTGLLKNSIGVTVPVPTAKGLQLSVGSKVKYALYHHEGTGIYGPKGSPIVPLRAKALAIPTPGGVIYRRSSKGSKSNPYLKDALETVLPNGTRFNIE